MSLTRGIVLQPENSIDVEPGAVTLIDQSRYRSNGAITGATWTRLPSGLWVLDFDGGNDRVVVPHDASLNFGTGDFTIEFWAREEEAGTTGNAIIKGRGWTYEPGWDMNGGYLRLYSDGTNDDFARIYYRPPDDVWQHHVFACTQASTPYITHYVNGSEDQAGYLGNAGKLGSIDNTTDVWIAYSFRGGVNRWWEASMALIKLYNYALSPGQILNRYESTKHWFGVHE